MTTSGNITRAPQMKQFLNNSATAIAENQADDTRIGVLVRLPTSMADRLTLLARRRGLTRQALLVMALHEFLERYEQ
jgi:hypothetical protein